MMTSIEERLKNLINEKYGSLLQFSKQNGLPNSTVNGVLTRGVMNSSIHNVLAICRALGISADELANGKIVPIGSEDSRIDIATHLENFRMLTASDDDIYYWGKKLSTSQKVFLRELTDVIIGHMERSDQYE